MRHRTCAFIAWLGLGCLMASAAGAQFQQYTAPGSLGIPTLSTRATLEKALGSATWRWGRLRVQPWLGLRDVSYVDNIFVGDPGTGDDDFTATLNMGIEAHLPIGPKIVLSTHFIPEYIWWLDHEELRGWHYQTGVGAYGYFNRMTVEAAVTATERQTYVSSEFQSPAVIETRKGSLNVAVEVAPPLALFANVSASQITYDDKGVRPFFPAALELLDRDEQVYRGGLRYTRQSGFAVGVGYETSQTDFDDEARDRSNTGSGPAFDIGYDGARWSASVDLVQRKLEERDDSQFREFKETTGAARFTLKSGVHFNPSLYGSRQLVYSLQPGSSYFQDERIGLAVEQVLGWRTALRAFVEDGTNEYVGVSALFPDRSDDYLGYGGEVQFKMRENWTFQLGVARSEFDSNLDAFDRELTTWRISLNLGPVRAVVN